MNEHQSSPIRGLPWTVAGAHLVLYSLYSGTTLTEAIDLLHQPASYEDIVIRFTFTRFLDISLGRSWDLIVAILLLCSASLLCGIATGDAGEGCVGLAPSRWRSFPPKKLWTFPLSSCYVLEEFVLTSLIRTQDTVSGRALVRRTRLFIDEWSASPANCKF